MNSAYELTAVILFLNLFLITMKLLTNAEIIGNDSYFKNKCYTST